MAGYVGSNYGIQAPTEGGNTSSTRLILKEELRRQWYVYTTTVDTDFRPYPVFDQAGNPCAPLGNPDSHKEVDILPDSFAAVRIATFAGTQKNLEFIDMCSDIQQYNNEGVGYLKTPYEFLVTALRRMLPMKTDRTKTVDGFPTPRQLVDMANPYGIQGSVNCVVLRCALLRHKGQPMTLQAATGGILPTAVLLIKQQGAVGKLYELLKTQKEVTQPLSANNSVLSSMFNLLGSALSVQTLPSTDGKTNATFTITQTFDQSYAMRMSQALQVTLADDTAYWGALRGLFGNYQSIGDIFNIMTVDKMVEVLKANYPISWLWYAWKDSPYASLISAEEKMAAMSDPEMAQRFGVDACAPTIGSQANGMNNYGTPRPQINPQAANNNMQGYPAPTAQPPVNNVQGYPAAAPQVAPAPAQAAPAAPNWNPAGYGNADGGIQQPTNVGQVPPAYPSGLEGGGSNVQAEALDMNARMQALAAKYSNNNDGIKY